jgi:BASS family bile acid:Na+ symporter
MLVLLALAAGAVVAFLLPGPFLAARPALEPAFAITMLLVGTLIDRAQFRAFAAAPRRPLAGLAAQYTIMPISALAVSAFYSDPQIRTGTILVGCMPGAMASNVMTLLFAGDVLLSVTMTSLATLLSPLVLSFWLPLLAGARLEVPVSAIVLDALKLVVVPVLAGIGARQILRSAPRWWNRLAATAASLSILFILLVVVAANRQTLGAVGPAIVAGMLALNLAGYTLAFACASALCWPSAQRRTLVIEVGMQNAGLGAVLATSHLGPAGALPSAIYTIICLFTAAAALPLARRSRHWG